MCCLSVPSGAPVSTRLTATSEAPGSWPSIFKNLTTSLAAGGVGVTIIIFNRLGIDLDKM